MSGVSALVGASLAVFLFAVVWHRESRRSLVFTPFLLFGVNEVFRNWPAAIAAPALDLSADYYPLFVMLCGFYALLGGFVIGAGIARFRASDPVRYRAAPVEIHGANRYVAVLLVGAAGLAAIGIVFYQGLPPVTMSLAALGSEAAYDAAVQFGAARRSITKGHYFGGEYRGQGVFRVTMQVCWPILTAISFILYHRLRELRWLVLTGVLFFLTFLFAAGDGTRGPFLWTIVYLIVVASFLRPVRVRTLAFGVCAFFALAIGISALSPKLAAHLEDGTLLRAGVPAIGQRVLLSNGLNTVAIIELVRSGQWEHRGGAVHTQRFANTLPGVRYGELFTYELYRTMYPGTRATTYATATYMGDAYIDFGLPGVVVIYIFIGLLLAQVQSLMLRIPRTPIRLALTAFLALALGRMAMFGPTGMMVSALVAISFAAGLRLLLALCPQESRALFAGWNPAGSGQPAVPRPIER